MPLTLSIQPSSDTLDLWGDVDLSSTFSLSGHVSVSVTSLPSLFARQRSTARILLESLTVTFDGQSETLTPGTGYGSVRLCSTTCELLPSGPLDLSNDGHEDSDKPCQWNVTFDVPIPGWLPTTSDFGDGSLQATGTSYALYATATFVDVSRGQYSFSFANLCGPARSRVCTVDAPRRPIILRRFVEPQPGTSSEFSAFPMSLYIVNAHRSIDSNNPLRKAIPGGVLEKIQVVASIPCATAMNETSIPFVLRVHGKDLDDSERTRLRITEFSIDVEQVEVYRNNNSTPVDVEQHPIPPPTHQPPHVPLRNPHPIHALYDTGFLGTSRSSVKRSFSIHPPWESDRYVISGDDRIFAQRQDSSSDNHWYMLKTKIPIYASACVRDWAGSRGRRLTESSPLFSVEHRMQVIIHCEYDPADSSEPIPERLHFSLPMRFVNVPEVTTPSRTTLENGCGEVQKNEPRPQTLPAYSQLFHSNGERKSDDSTPLPLYEPPSAPMSLSPRSGEQRTS